MKRRKLLAGVGSLAAGGGAVIGTGAFSQATAQREFELTIERDNQSPYLKFIPTSEYAEYRNEAFKLSFRDNSSGGKGIPSRANTLFEDVFEIQNLGTNTVSVWAPSFLSGQDPKTQAGPASTNFLVDKSGTGVKYDSSGTSCSDRSGVSVSHVDISWPAPISPKKKPSNPVPQVGSSIDCVGQVDGSYKGVRYPGGYLNIGPGNKKSIDVRFTVSNQRRSNQPGLDEIFDVSFYIRADTSPPSTIDDWRL